MSSNNRIDNDDNLSALETSVGSEGGRTPRKKRPSGIPAPKVSPSLLSETASIKAKHADSEEGVPLAQSVNYLKGTLRGDSVGSGTPRKGGSVRRSDDDSQISVLTPDRPPWQGPGTTTSSLSPASSHDWSLSNDPNFQFKARPVPISHYIPDALPTKRDLPTTIPHSPNVPTRIRTPSGTPPSVNLRSSTRSTKISTPSSTRGSSSATPRRRTAAGGNDDDDLDAMLDSVLDDHDALLDEALNPDHMANVRVLDGEGQWSAPPAQVAWSPATDSHESTDPIFIGDVDVVDDVDKGDLSMGAGVLVAGTAQVDSGTGEKPSQPNEAMDDADGAGAKAAPIDPLGDDLVDGTEPQEEMEAEPEESAREDEKSEEKDASNSALLAGAVGLAAVGGAAVAVAAASDSPAAPENGAFESNNVGASANGLASRESVDNIESSTDALIEEPITGTSLDPWEQETSNPSLEEGIVVQSAAPTTANDSLQLSGGVEDEMYSEQDAESEDDSRAGVAAAVAGAVGIAGITTAAVLASKDNDVGGQSLSPDVGTTSPYEVNNTSGAPDDSIGMLDSGGVSAAEPEADIGIIPSNDNNVEDASDGWGDTALAEDADGTKDIEASYTRAPEDLGAAAAIERGPLGQDVQSFDESNDEYDEEAPPQVQRSVVRQKIATEQPNYVSRGDLIVVIIWLIVIVVVTVVAQKYTK